MPLIVIIGFILSLAGLAGIIWCIVGATRLRRTELPDDAVRAAIGRIVLWHTVAICVAFLGLGLLIVGMLLA